jgi:hypothetical protein
VLEPELVTKLGMKATDFKEYVFDAYKFEYDADEGALGADDLGDYGFEDYGEEGFLDDYGAEYGDELDDVGYRRLVDAGVDAGAGADDTLSAEELAALGFEPGTNLDDIDWDNWAPTGCVYNLTLENKLGLLYDNT